jgi:hypothetical protein
VIDAMDEKKFNAGDFVIRQGEDGEVLYVVDNGQLDCFKVFKKGEAEKYLVIIFKNEKKQTRKLTNLVNRSVSWHFFTMRLEQRRSKPKPIAFCSRWIERLSITS